MFLSPWGKESENESALAAPGVVPFKTRLLKARTRATRMCAQRPCIQEQPPGPPTSPSSSRPSPEPRPTWDCVLREARQGLTSLGSQKVESSISISWNSGQRARW